MKEVATVFTCKVMSTIKIFKKIEKSLELYGFWESSRALDAGLIEHDEQSKWIDCWKTQVSYRPFNGWDTWRISRAQSEPDTRPMWCLHPHLEASNAIFAFWESRLNNNWKPCLYNNWELCLYSNWESRLYKNWELRLNFIEAHISTWSVCYNRIYEGCVLSYTKSMSLHLESVQQYTGKSNR